MTRPAILTTLWIPAGASLLASVLLFAPAASGEDAPAKKTEGRYFLELDEVMISAHQFDTEIATVDPGGPRAGLAAEEVDSNLSKRNLTTPTISFGLNRPAKQPKMELIFTVFDFTLRDQRIPQDFLATGQVVTTPLIPAGIVYQRQGFVGPNWGNDFAFIRRADYRSGVFQVQRNIFENKTFRLRWVGGLKYAQLNRSLGFFQSFAPEQITDRLHFQDFYTMNAEIRTQGFGPDGGVAGRFLLGKKKKWSLEGQADLAMIPEATTASYYVSMIEDSFGITDPRLIGQAGAQYRIFGAAYGAPTIPGVVGSGGPGDAFNATLRQEDFTATTFLLSAAGGIHFQPNSWFTIGLEAWQMRWSNLLTDTGIVDTIQRSATYEQITATPQTPDPQLQDTESVIHSPRFSKRDTYVFDGLRLSLKFDF